MKFLMIYLLAIVFASSAVAMRPPDDPDAAQIWYDEMESTFDVVLERDNKVSRIEGLGEFLLKFGQRAQLRNDPRWERLFERSRHEIESIPGHGEFYLESILNKRLDLDQDPGNARLRSEYDRRRTNTLQILGSLKSPEALWVLGSFLSDDRDDPKRPGVHKKVWGQRVRANSFLAACSISRMNLGNPPIVEDDLYIDSDEALAATRHWWEKVASGERSFSFVGLDKHFRFLPGGVAEEVVASGSRTRNSDPTLTVSESDDNSRFLWFWPLLLVVLFAGGAFLVKGLRVRAE